MSGSPPEKKPAQVVYAQVFLYAGLALGLAASLVGLPELARQSGASITAGVFFNLLVVAPVVFLVVMIGKARNWARIALLIVVGLGLAADLLAALQTPGYVPKNPFSMIVSVFYVVGVSLLFGRDAAAWFKRCKTPTAQPLSPEMAREASTSVSRAETAQNSDELLFVLKYTPGRRFVLVVAFGLLTAMLIWVAVGLMRELPSLRLGSVIETILVIPLILMGFSFFYWFLLCREIRHYRDRIVQVWWPFGSYELLLRDARLADSPGLRARGKQRALLDRNMRKPLLFFKHISYFENLTDPRDWDRLNRLLADLSGRKVEEFEQSSVTMDPFIQNKAE